VASPLDLASSLRRRFPLHSGRTVTDILETVTEEPLVADVISLIRTPAGAANVLDVEVGQELVLRIAVLRGERTHRRYLHAETLYVPDRLPLDALTRLERTTDPIGRVLADFGAPWSREPISPAGRIVEAYPSHGPDSSEVVWERAYRLLVDGTPTFAIHEWFLQPVLDAVERSVGMSTRPA
jgi:chorismate-pyruvate lyase